MSQTALDWLVSELPTIDWSDPHYLDKLEQAKSMEKEQIVASFVEGMRCQNFQPNMGRAKLYYKSTFNTTDK
jgi:hypothetical protein